MDEIPNGAIADPRSDTQIAMDYNHYDVLGGSVVATPNWIEKTEYVITDRRFQTTSSSCGGQSGAKGIEPFLNKILSANIYRARSNYPDGGMYIQEIGSLLTKGTCLETDSPSQNMTEDQMNAVVLPTNLPYKIGSYYMLPSGSNLDMDLIATALDIGHSVIFLIRSNNTEYGSVPKVDGNPTTFAHFVACVNGNYTLYQGEKAFVIEDSCAPHSTLNQSGQRIFTESWLKQRNYGIMALIPSSSEKPLKTHYTFNTAMYYGTMNSQDVKNLQDVLKYENCMDISIPSTGNYLNATKQAVMKFQVKYFDDILKPAGLTEPTGDVGFFTRRKLNNLSI